MSNAKQETIADIVAEMRLGVKDWKGERLGVFDCFADRIEAAHQRDVAKLEHWIKSAARWIKCHDIYHTSGDDLIKQAKEILNDNGEFLFKKGE